MDKKNLIDLVLREIKEMEVLVNGLADIDQIPPVMFKLADAKVDNIKNLLNLLGDANVNTEIATPVAQKQTEEKASESSPANIIPEDKQQEPAGQVIQKSEEPVEEVTAEEHLAEIEEGLTEEIPLEEDKPEEKAEEPVVAEEPKPTIIVEDKKRAQQEAPKEIKEETPPPAEKTAAPSTEKKKEKKSIIGETIIEKKSSVNEKLSEKVNTSFDKTLSGKKITDLKKSINLNDRFRFQKELFKGNASLLNQTLDVLNDAEDKNEALDFLSSFGWDEENQAVKDFMELVNRRFL